MDFDKFKDLLSYGLGLAVIAASIVAYFRANLAKTQIEQLRGDRDDQAKRIERQDGDLIRLDKENTALKAKADAQQNEIRILREALSGKAQLDHLQQQFDAHDKRVDERHDTLLKAVHDLADIGNANHFALGELLKRESVDD